MVACWLLVLGISFLAASNIAKAMPERDSYPQIISHRGASGYLPEHSLPAYQLAIDLLSDYIEPDLCLSKDGVFVALHDLILDDTTNVASFPEFQDRNTTKIIEGNTMSGFFVNDFTFFELQQLRLNQRLPNRTTLYNSLFQIPTFASIISLAQNSYSSTNRTVGIYVELKHPSYFRSLGYDMEDMLLTALSDGGYLVSGPSVPNDLNQVLPVVIQSFDNSSLQYLRDKTSIPLVQLLEIQPSSFWTPQNIAEIATYAQSVGPEKSYIGTLPFESGKELVDLIHSYGLFIHPWTFRADSGILAPFNGDFEKEEAYFYCCLGTTTNYRNN